MAALGRWLGELVWVEGPANFIRLLCLCTLARANASGRVRLNCPPPQPQATKHKAQLVNLTDSLSFFALLMCLVSYVLESKHVFAHQLCLLSN